MVLRRRNNLRIRRKLLFGFLTVSLLVFIAGGIGIYTTYTISDNADRILYDKVPLKDVSMEAIISLQNGAYAASEYLLKNDDLEPIEEELNTSINEFDMWIAMVRHGTGSETFQNSAAGKLYAEKGIDISTPKGSEDMISIIEEADQYHEAFTENARLLLDNHNRKLTYHFNYSDKNWNIVDFLTLVELQHKEWIDQLYEAAQNDRQFTGETDPTQCFFGQWFYNYSVDDQEVNQIFDELEPLHIDLHESARAINNTQGSETKLSIYNDRVVPLKDEIDTIFTRLREYLNPVVDSIHDKEEENLQALLSAAAQSEEALVRFEELIDSELNTAMHNADVAFRRGIIGLVIAVVIGFIAAIAIGVPVSMNIAKPLALVTEQSNQISKGNFDTDRLTITNNDEIGEMGDSFNHMIESFKYKAGIIDKIAEGDFTVDIEKASQEDKLGDSLIQMRDSLSKLIKELNTTISQVSSGADQISQSSQSLSQGASQQASSVEQISSSLNQVNSQAQQNAENAGEANKLAEQATDSATSGNEQMKELVSSMEKINASSDEIGKIIKVIDDIAFQINLLALNANVEAARAGKYGKGFAVVAEEVRNLAVRSTDSVNEITAKVEESLQSIREGNDVVQKTDSQLEEIVSNSKKVAEFLEEIAHASKEQAQAIDQISDGINQIDDVTQSNTASAEESASAAEQLSSQAQMVKQMIEQFSVDRNGSSDERLLSDQRSHRREEHTEKT
jgi:methyl-accepting chemotaxis protein